jgi:hypothetical protein
MLMLTRKIACLLLIAITAGCSAQSTPDDPIVTMGDFSLGHNIVVANEPTIGPFSRKASDEELKSALTTAIDQRFSRYDGEKIYNFGIKIDAYALALPGVPIVFNPKSVMVITMSIWDDAAGEILNEEAKVFTVFEGATKKTFVSSGLTQNKAKQLENLSNNAAKMIQDWILEHPEWVGLPPAMTLAEGEIGEPMSEPALELPETDAVPVVIPDNGA